MIDDLNKEIAKYNSLHRDDYGIFLTLEQKEVILDFTTTIVANEKKLIRLRTKLEFYKKLDKKLDKILNAEIEIEDYSNEIYSKIQRLETELTDLKCEMDLPDDRWDEDESA